MKHNSTAPWPITPEPPPGMESETALPARPAGFVSDFLVPASQSALTGGLVAALLAFGLLELFDLDVKPLKLWAGLALGITCLTWLVLLVDTRKLLWAIEKLTNLDIDQDGATGEPGAHLVFVNREKAKQEAATARADAEWLLFLGFVSRLGVKGTALAMWQVAEGDREGALCSVQRRAGRLWIGAVAVLWSRCPAEHKPGLGSSGNARDNPGTT